MVAIASNPRKSRRKGRHKGRRRGRNPGAVSLRRPVAALTAGFKVPALVDAGIVAVGAFGNYYLRDKITNMLGLSGTWRDGIGSYAIELSSAGLLLFVPKVGKKLFTGALIGTAVRGLKQAVPTVAKLGEFLSEPSGVSGYLEEDEANISGYLEEGQYNRASAIPAGENMVDSAAADLFD